VKGLGLKSAELRRDNVVAPLRMQGVRALALVVLYAIVVGWLTWPLPAYITTHHPTLSPGRDFDSLYTAWALAWESRVLSSGSLAVANANIYYPEPSSLFYGPVAFGALPYFAPVYLLTGNPALALNLLFLGCLTLTAAMVHFVVHSWTRLHTAGLVASVALLANRWLLWAFVPEAPQLSVLCYFPLIILLSASPSLTWPRTAMLGLLVIAQGMADVLYVAPAVLIPITLLALYRLARRHTRPHGFRLLVVVVIASTVLIAVHAPYFSIEARNPALPKQTLWKLDPLKMSLASPWELMAYSSPLAIATAVPALILTGVLLAIVRWRGTPREASAWRHCLLWMATGIAMSLPANVTWNGQLYALPHRELIQSWQPLGRLFSSSPRLRVGALVAVALLCGLTFAELLRHCGLTQGKDSMKRFVRGGIAIAFCTAIYVQYESTVGQPACYGPRFTPAPPVEVPHDSPVLRELRRRGGPTIEVPLPPGGVAPWAHAVALYRSIFHWQPLLNGYGSFWPAQFPALMRTAVRLPQPEAVRELHQQTGLAFILVRKRPAPDGSDDRGTAQREEWMRLAAAGGRDDLELIAADDDLLLFHVTGGGGPSM
jgi:hypothetical protein